MKPLDFVKTPKGNIAIVTDVIKVDDNSDDIAIEFFGGGNPGEEENAWWNSKNLIVIDNLPSLMARLICNDHHESEALQIFPIK